MFVRVRVAIGAPYKALLSARGGAEDQALKYVFTVNDKNEVVVARSPWARARWARSHIGRLAAGERVIVMVCSACSRGLL